ESGRRRLLRRPVGLLAMTRDGFFIGPDQQRALVTAEKPALRILPTRELNAETPAHLLDDDITPVSLLFARNTGTMPLPTASARAPGPLAIAGCVRTPRRWTLRQLQQQFAAVTRTAVLECAGNGRAFFPEPAGTVLWQHGAAGCLAWTGVRLRELLHACELTGDAVYTGHHSPGQRLHGRRPPPSPRRPPPTAPPPPTAR